MNDFSTRRLGRLYFRNTWTGARCRLGMCVSHVNESCHMWMSHVSYEWFFDASFGQIIFQKYLDRGEMSTGCVCMSYVNKSCRIWMARCLGRLYFRNTWTGARCQLGVCVSHVNESRHMWMSRVSCEWVMSHVNESWHVWMSHVTCEWVVSHVWRVTWLIHMRHDSFTCDMMWISHVTCEWVMSHVNESWHVWMSHVTCEWVGSHVWARHSWTWARCWLGMCVSRVNVSCHMWMSHATREWNMSHVNESWHPANVKPHTHTHMQPRTPNHTHTRTRTHTHSEYWGQV